MGNGDFDPPPCRSEIPESFITKIGHFEYIMRCNTHAHFYGNRRIECLPHE